MKYLLIVIALFFISPLKAQCVKLYVKEHLSGDPICQLSEGDYLELCLNDKEVNGCPRDLYIYDMGYSSGSQTYELSLDKGWSTHYMTLMVNPTTQRFGFILQGQTALYSYFTESEMEKQRQVQETLNRKSDQEKYSSIDDALASGNVDLFKKLISSLYYPKSYPNYNTFEKMEEARKEKEDENLLKKLNTLIANNQPEEAANDYYQLHVKRYDMKAKISDALNKKIAESRISDALSDQILTRLIENNKNQFSEFAKGTYELTISPSGEVFVEKKQIFKDATLIQYKRYGRANDFKMPIFADAKIEVNIIRKEVGKEYVVVSTEKKVFETNKGEYYIGSFFKTSAFKIKDGGWEYNQKIETVFDQGVKKNHYRIEQKVIETTSVHGIVTSSNTKRETVVEKHFKRRWPTVLRRSIVLTVVPFFTTLRVIETSKIP